MNRVGHGVPLHGECRKMMAEVAKLNSESNDFNNDLISLAPSKMLRYQVYALRRCFLEKKFNMPDLWHSQVWHSSDDLLSGPSSIQAMVHGVRTSGLFNSNVESR